MKRIPKTSAAFLKAHFRLKQKVLPQFSLRAFARGAGVSATYAGQVLNGAKPLPISRLDKWARLLAMDDAAIGQTKDLLAREALGKRKLLFSTTSAAAPTYAEYALEPVAKITSLYPWYVAAILDFSTCQNYSDDSAYLAKRLGIGKVQVEAAIAHLKASGLLVLSDDGMWRKAELKLRIAARTSKSEIRQYHKEMITRAREHLLQNVSESAFERRLITGLTTAINPAHLPAAKRLLEEAIHQAAALLTEGPCTEAYQLNLQLFPLLLAE